MDELEPCPFCGAEDAELTFAVFSARQYRCLACGAAGPLNTKPAEALAAWNRRAADGVRTVDASPALHACAVIENYLADSQNAPYPSGAVKVLRDYIAASSSGIGGVRSPDGSQHG